MLNYSNEVPELDSTCWLNPKREPLTVHNAGRGTHIYHTIFRLAPVQSEWIRQKQTEKARPFDISWVDGNAKCLFSQALLGVNFISTTFQTRMLEMWSQKFWRCWNQCPESWISCCVLWRLHGQLPHTPPSSVSVRLFFSQWGSVICCHLVTLWILMLPWYFSSEYSKNHWIHCLKSHSWSHR